MDQWIYIGRENQIKIAVSSKTHTEGAMIAPIKQVSFLSKEEQIK